ncbi:MAG: hypothetical protein A3F16_00625 [Deltaproteobacteria bacterium RIFCSPHIGHO2_12_FULL_43_9]|nr:MAG: hypothetical protein A3F16_00625 [Deltaproteobacteria bacterium RIFCSPHIGHO2_12_FULL_43_9]
MDGLCNFEKSALILAGGRGIRFWPLSRFNNPKQFHDLLGKGKPILESTVKRLNGVVSKDQIFISTRGSLKESISNLNIVDKHQILCEPMLKNTAPAIAIAAFRLFKEYGDRILMVLPSDHMVEPVETFQRQLNEASKIAWERRALVCFGITPTRIATGYGYIQMGENLDGDSFSVKCFVEKPNKTTAEAYIKAGNFFWNAGIFVWRLSAILDAIKRELPSIWCALTEYEKSIGTDLEDVARDRFFLDVDPISIDFGVMEHHDNLIGIRAAFDWDDLGTWESLVRILPKRGENWSNNDKLITLNAIDNIVHVMNKRVALLDVDNLVIVDTEDTIFIASRGSAEKVMDLVSLLPERD